MFKKLTERFPVSAFTGSGVLSPAPAADSPASPGETVPADLATEEEEKQADAGDHPQQPTQLGAERQGDEGEEGNKTSATTPPKSADRLKAAIAERLNAETMSSAASIAASSMVGFMKKAQNVASVAAREGAAKATVWKNRALDAADMDALQRRLSYALDRSTGDVNLELLNFSYITDNIVAMGFPSMNLGTNRALLRDNPIDLVSMYLNDKHGGHYMIWNLSEEAYDYGYFDNQVLEFNFPGHPAPPLGLMFKICSSIENWLQADNQNLAAIHCLTGKGRTGTVIACYLAWIGRFPNALEALEYVAEQRNTTVEKLTIPSQRRYIQYFTNVMDGVKPGSSPLLLRRVIINTIPVFGTRRVLEVVKKTVSEDNAPATEEEGEQPNVSPSETPDEQEMQEIIEEGCCPYLQIFKGGKLVFTTTWRDMESGNGVQWASTNDGSISFNVNCMLQGDILIRCRHLTDAGERVSMFRGAFHTGYIPQGILRLTKAQLDGACGDSRFDQDFFVDLIFADVQTESASSNEKDGESATAPKSEGVSLTEEDRQAYEDMLHRDEAFWEDIEARKERLQKQREEQMKKKQAEAAAAAEAAKQAKKAEQEALKQSSFSIDGESSVKATPVNRRGSWNEEKDKELMSELESLTADALEKAVEEHKLEEKAGGTTTTTDTTDGDLAKEFEDMKKLEKELGLDSFTSDLANLPDGKLDPHLELLDAEIKGLDELSPKAAGAEDVMNFAADDFDELEEYLSGLTSSSSKS